jgi:DNA anti-recombination protein RmuC
MHAEVTAEVQRVRAEVTAVKAEVQQVRAEVTTEVQEMRAEVTAVKAEVQQVRAEVQDWRAEMEKKVRTVELNEAQLRTQILGTAEGLGRVEQNLQEEVAQMCAKLEMMQNEQEKKKGNEEDRLNALVREHVEKLAQQLEEQEDAKLQEYQQSLEEWLKRGQRKFQSTIAERVFATKIVAASSPHGAWR